MAEETQLRLVTVEFLRAGPPHNQLLSPLTQYLAICGDSGADVITVPYEHATFQRRLKELRYEGGDPDDRQAMLHDIGVDIGRILGSVPGLPGSLTADLSHAGTIVHLRLTLSASELALLPFELAKAPVGPKTTGESWLAIQTRPPVCITRNIRTVSPEGVVWPEDPRILFIVGDPDVVPYAEHLGALIEAIQDFLYPGRDDDVRSRDGSRITFGDLLTVLVNPTLADVLEECRDQQYTHVHILTHGDVLESSRESYGLVLRGPDGAPDVVSGERFAGALTSVSGDRIHRPTVATVASCDSGNVGTVTIPGASFAHALHQSGIPLVVASQFPLSVEGSVPMADALYKGLLWGEHPLVSVQRLRAELHAKYTSKSHDWASLVVYEALPQSLSRQLDTLQYHQAKRAMNAALELVDRAVAAGDAQPTPESLTLLDERIERAVERLPLKRQYVVECLGLRASSRKRLAHAAFTLMSQLSSETAVEWRDQYDLLEQARLDYGQAARGLLVNEAGALQRFATLHWVLVQYVSLSAVLGKGDERTRWEASKLCAELYLDHRDPEERAWAHGSLAELCLARLAVPDLSPAERLEYSDQAVHHAEEIVRLYPSRDGFPVKSTRSQFERYMDWWGTERFERDLGSRDIKRASWAGEHGVLETAKRVVLALQPPARSSAGGRRGPSRKPAASSGHAVDPAPQSPPAASDPNATTPTTLSASPAKVSETQLRAPVTRQGPFVDITMLPAGNGDAIWIEYGDQSATHRWIIDCGTQQTANELLRRVDALPAGEKHFELFVLSHIDSDHIGGALPFFQAVQRGLTFDEVWYNGWRQISGQLGARQGAMFATAIVDFALPWNVWTKGAAIVVGDGDLPTCTLPGGMTLTLLSPKPDGLKKLTPIWTRELKRYGLAPDSRVDYTQFLKGTPSTSTDIDTLADAPFDADAGVPNGTSIVVLAEFKGISVLLAADAHAPVLSETIGRLLKKRGTDRLKLDAFKVSHHGSQHNVSSELVKQLDCHRYLVSTNGDHFAHPDRQAIARILKHGGDRPTLYFNYRTKYNNVWEQTDLQTKYGYSTVYPEGENAGLTVSLSAK